MPWRHHLNPLMNSMGASTRKFVDGFQLRCALVVQVILWACGAYGLMPAEAAAAEVGRSSLSIQQRLAGATRMEGPSSYAVDSWQTEQGLPRNAVLSMVQSSDGYLWCGTGYGLARFDGLQFTVFNSANTPGMVRGQITALLADRKNRLWVGSDLGELVFLKEGRVTPITKQGGAELNRIVEDDEGQIWLGAGEGLGLVENGVARIPAVPGKLVRPVRRLVFDAIENVMWFDQDGLIFARRRGEVLPLRKSGAITSIDVNTFAISPKGGLWIVDMTRKLGRTALPASFGEPEPLPMPTPGWVGPLLEDRSGQLWIAVGGHGLYRLGIDGTYEHFGTGSGLNDNNVSCVLEDREGGIWVGTHHGGLHLIKRRAVRVFGQADGLSGGAAFSVVAAGYGSVYTCTQAGQLHRIEGGVVTPIPLGHQAQTHTLGWQRSGRLWGNHFGARLDAYETSGTNLHSVINNPIDIYNRCTAMAEDSSGRMWFGGHFGLASHHAGRFERWDGPGQVPPVWVRALAAGADGVMWIGTFRDGLYSHTNGVFRKHPFAGDIRNATLQTLYVDSNGIIWIGAAAEGLLRYDGTRWTRYSKADGLADEAIAGMIEDDRGHLWMSSLRGVFRVSRDDLEAFAQGRQTSIRSVSYAARDGLATVGCSSDSQPNACRTPDGRLWFATNKGLAMIDPSSLDPNTNAPPVVIEEVMVDDVVRRVGSTEGTRSAPIRVPAGTQRVEIRYTGLSFSSPEQVQFQYRMEHYEPTWVRAGTRRTAYYTKMPPGDYSFQARAANDNGVWSQKGAEVWMRFEPHYWQTWWFRVGLTGVCALTMGVVVRHFSVQKVQRQLVMSQYQRALEDERARIAQDMHDQLGSHLTRIGLMSEIAHLHRRDEAKLEAHFEGIKAVTRDLAREMDQVVWAVNPHKDTLEDLASYCCSHAEEFFALTSIACRIDLPDDLPALRFSSKTRYQFLLTVKEALNNIAKHADATEVTLRWTVTARELTLVIEDNGRGFDLSAADDRRNGLTNMKSRVTALGGRFDIVSAPGQGTRVCLSVSSLATPEDGPMPSPRTSEGD